MKTLKAKIKSTYGYLSACIESPDIKTDKLAILCPGYLDYKDYAHLSSLSHSLSKDGYTVVRFDPTGTWDSDGDISMFSLSQYLEDIKNVLEYMLDSSKFKNILLGGHSLGGSVSLIYATIDHRISQVLAIMSALTPQDEEKCKKWMDQGYILSSRDIPNTLNEKREYIVPYSFLVDRIKRTNINELKNIKVPVILVAGELDEEDTVDEVKETYDHINEPKRLIVIPGIAHGYRRNENEINIVNEEILKSLKSL